MKKYLAILLSVILVSLTIFAGCEVKNNNSQSDSAQKDTTLTALVSPSSLLSDCLHSNDMVVDKAFEDWYIQRYGEIKVPEPKEELTVAFQGKEYHGKYSRMSTNTIAMRTFYHYSGEQGLFVIDAVSGELVEILISCQYVNAPISNQLLDKCKKEAQRIAEQYIDTSCFVLETKTQDALMHFYYNQYVDGVKTTNGLHLVFDCKGRLTTFANNLSDGYKLVSLDKLGNLEKMVTTLYSEKAKQTVLTKVENIMVQNNIAKDDISEYKITDEELYIMPDGKLVKKCIYDAEIKDNNPIEDEDGNLFYSPGSFIVMVAVFEE